MHGHNLIFKGQLIEKKSTTLKVWVLGRVCLDKYQDVTIVCTTFFQGLFENIILRSEALVLKYRTFYRSVPYPMHK